MGQIRRSSPERDSLRNDVDGALAAGLRAVWVNRDGRPRPLDRADLVEVRGLDALPGVLAGAG